MKPEMHPLADEQAIGWLVLLQDNDANDEDRRRFRIWLDADPAHRRAWAEAERLWDGLGRFAGRPEWQARLAPPQGQPARTRPWVGMAIAAALGITALGLGWQMVPVGILADHRTGVGEREVLRLEDGSEVELGTASAVDLEFSPERREVHLLAGEAFFTVTPDPSRPFVVRAGDGQITVRGTAFNVKIGEEVRVSVTEHVVEVSTGGLAGVSVSAGEEVSFDARRVSPPRIADLDNVQAWRQGQLVFIDTPLDAVIAELGRYRHGHIRLLGGDLGRLRVTAVFDAARPDEAIATIARSLGLRVWRASDLLIGLSRG